MKIGEFQNLISTRYKFEKYWGYTTSIAVILAGLLLPIYLYLDNKNNAIKINGYVIAISLLLILLGIGGLKVLRTKYKIRIYSNEHSKEVNQAKIKTIYRSLTNSTTEIKDTYINFPYKRKWWTLSYSVHLLAENKLIAIYVQSMGSSRSGFIDFGASKRLENHILDMID